MSKYANPFKPGAGLEPHYIAGRDEELQTFERLIEAAPRLPKNLIISGLRGTGKTVFLRNLRGLCVDNNWLYVEREFNDRFDHETDFSQAVATDIYTKLKGLSIARDIKEVGKGVFEVLRESEITYKDLSVKLGKPDKTQLLEDYFKDLLLNSSEIISKGEKEGIVFLYDEFHEITDIKSKRQFPLASFIGALSQAQREGAPFILVATGLPQIQQNFAKAKSYTERMFSVIKLSNLSPEETIHVFTHTLKEANVTFTNELLDYLNEETGGYPYFIQFYGHFIVQNIPKERITLADVKEIEPLLLKELDASFFDARYGKASDNEKDILFAIAAIGSSAKYSEIIKESNIGHGTAKKLVSRLESKGLVLSLQRGVYCFTIPLFREYLLRKLGQM